MFSTALARVIRRGARSVPGIELPERAVHVWLLPDGLVHDACDGLAHTLSDDEVQRAVRYRRQRDRERFIARRGVLRVLLGGYHSRDPSSLRFTTSGTGKPALALTGAHPVRFSVSQTDGLAAIACARSHEPGIDVERSVSSGDTLRIGGEVLTAVERDSLCAHGHTTGASLLRTWTRKEALLKAVGTGLSGASGAWSVLADTHTGQAYWRALYRGTELRGWTLTDVKVPDAFIAALAIPCQDVAISVIDWEDTSVASK